MIMQRRHGKEIHKHLNLKYAVLFTATYIQQNNVIIPDDATIISITSSTIISSFK